jgi:DNA-binding FadR family transcriptional regulator
MNFDSDKTVTANAVQALQDYILKNDLKPGDSLPTEAEFCGLFSVSRGMIREALQYFRTLGIIESRPRKGMTIKSFLPDNLFGPYLPFCRHSEDRAAICEMRVIVDLGITHLLVKNATKKDLLELSDIAKAMGKSELPEICSLDLKFHRKLLAIAGNRFLSCLEPFIIDYFEAISNPNPQYYQNPEKYRAAEKSKHLAMIEAIKNHDEGLLRKLLKNHYSIADNIK